MAKTALWSWQRSGKGQDGPNTSSVAARRKVAPDGWWLPCMIPCSWVWGAPGTCFRPVQYVKSDRMSFPWICYVMCDSVLEDWSERLPAGLEKVSCPIGLVACPHAEDHVAGSCGLSLAGNQDEAGALGLTAARTWSLPTAWVIVEVGSFPFKLQMRLQHHWHLGYSLVEPWSRRAG